MIDNNLLIFYIKKLADVQFHGLPLFHRIIFSKVVPICIQEEQRRFLGCSTAERNALCPVLFVLISISVLEYRTILMVGHGQPVRCADIKTS